MKQIEKLITEWWNEIKKIKKVISSKDAPEDFKRIFYESVYEFNENLILLVKTRGKKKREIIEKIGESTRKIMDGAVDWYLDVIRHDENEISKYTDTTEIIEKIEKCEDLRDKSITYANNGQYDNAIKTLSMIIQNIKEIEKMINRKRIGIRNIAKKERMNTLIGIFGSILSIIGLPALIYSYTKSIVLSFLSLAILLVILFIIWWKYAT